MNFQQLTDYIQKLPPEQRPAVSADSRTVKAGDIFVAVKGTKTDGHNFIGSAIKNGAKFVVCNNDNSGGADAEFIKVSNPADCLGLLAQGLADWPAKKMDCVAVTGTNGKTTTAYMFQSIAQQAGAKCGLIGTIANDIGGSAEMSSMTTPDAVQLAKLCSRMAENGCRYMAIEASSHAISQDRLSGINFKAAAFTNLTGDHLDYHKTMQAYCDAKCRLFRKLTAEATAVINADDAAAEVFAKAANCKKLFYSLKKPADITAEIISMDINATIFNLKIKGRTAEVVSPLIGRHNIYNHLAAAGMAYGCGFDICRIAEGLAALKNVPGRLQKVDSDKNFTVIIDYAHTDDALENVLQTLKPLCKGRLAVVFGCGGDRDKTKRPRMAQVAEKLADKIYITSDNPRTEEPEKIIDDIAAGFKNKNYVSFITDRRDAIAQAVAEAKQDDIILIAGKGHEDYQIIGTEKQHFSDVETAEEFLS